MKIVLQDKVLVDEETGLIISPDITPRFQNQTYEDYVKAFPEVRYLTPMKFTACDDLASVDTKGKIAQRKYDGFRALLQITSNGIRTFSYNISKKTNWFGESTDNLPHIRDLTLQDNSWIGTVLDCELVVPTGLFSDVAGVAGSATLPETALQNQLEKGFAEAIIFDCLYYKGVRVENMPLYKRMSLYYHFCNCHQDFTFLRLSDTYFEDMEVKKLFKDPKWSYPVKNGNFIAFRDHVWEQGGEGIMVKSVHSKYEQKRIKDLKIKEMQYKDVFIMGYNDPTKTFDEDERKTDLKDWQYWESGTPVTKPYAMGWIGSIVVGVLDEDGKARKVADIKGLDDATLEYVKKNKEALIGTVLEIKFNGFNDETKESCRHPRFNRWVDGRGKESCTWEAWINS